MTDTTEKLQQLVSHLTKTAGKQSKSLNAVVIEPQADSMQVKPKCFTSSNSSDLFIFLKSFECFRIVRALAE